MDGLIKLDDQVSILTRAPNGADLEKLAEENIRSVVNFRAPGESGEVLAPEVEGKEAKKVGLSYLSIPVKPSDLDAQKASKISSRLASIPGPIAVHCASGKRATLIALADWARRNDASASEAATKAHAKGMTVDATDLQSLIEQS